jgi:opacity protein-like surface antigen
MKKFLIVAGLLSVIATPAFAQAFNPVLDPDLGTAYSHQTKDSANGAFARADTNAPGDQLENYNNGRGGLGGYVHNGYVVDGD